MFDRIEDLKPGTVPYVKSLGYLVVITGVEGDCYTAINSYGRDVLIPKNAEIVLQNQHHHILNLHHRPDLLHRRYCYDKVLVLLPKPNH